MYLYCQGNENDIGREFDKKAVFTLVVAIQNKWVNNGIHKTFLRHHREISKLKFLSIFILIVLGCLGQEGLIMFSFLVFS